MEGGVEGEQDWPRPPAQRVAEGVGCYSHYFSAPHSLLQISDLLSQTQRRFLILGSGEVQDAQS